MFLQSPLYLLVIFFNVYCLAVIYKNWKLHTLDYFLVAMQSVCDLIFTGVLGCIDYFLEVWSVFTHFCSFAGFTPYDYVTGQLSIDHLKKTALLAFLLHKLLKFFSVDLQNYYCPGRGRMVIL